MTLNENDRPGNPPILLRLPSEIGMPLLADAMPNKKQRRPQRTVQAVILDILATHYAVSPVVPARGRPKKTAD